MMYWKIWILHTGRQTAPVRASPSHRGSLRRTYTRARVAWSPLIREKWFSTIVRVPVNATWPQPQKRATPEKQRMVATREA